MDIRMVLEKHNFVPDKLKDQFLLTDETVAQKMAAYAQLKETDVVLEVGAGTGILTRELAKKAERVIVFEIDTRFKPFLDNLSENVEVRYEDAWDYVQLHGKWWKKKEYNKVVANLPYSFVEKFLHNLTFWEYEKAILMIPLKMTATIQKNPVFSSFFTLEVKEIVSKEKYYPIPRTNSAIIDLIHLPNMIETKNLGFFLRQYMYQHEDQLVKNSLREGIILFTQKARGMFMSKKQATTFVEESGITPILCERTPGEEIYEEVSNKFNAALCSRL